jgi:hypothetical protein
MTIEAHMRNDILRTLLWLGRTFLRDLMAEARKLRRLR